MSNPADARRRWFGTFFLIMAGGLLIWGQTILKPHLGNGLGFLLYWLVCFSFTGLAILTALLDLRIIRCRTRDAQRDLFKRATMETDVEENRSPESGEPTRRDTTKSGS